MIKNTVTLLLLPGNARKCVTMQMSIILGPLYFTPYITLHIYSINIK